MWAWLTLLAGVATLALAVATASGATLALGLAAVAAAVRMLDGGSGAAVTRTAAAEPPRPASVSEAAKPRTCIANERDDRRGGVPVNVVDWTPLPGIGTRYSLTAADGQRLAVICHPSGRRDLAVYETRAADTPQSFLTLSSEQAHDVAELLRPRAVIQESASLGPEATTVAGLPVTAGSRHVGRSISTLAACLPADARVLAVVRAGHLIPTPDHGTVLNSGDVVVAAGDQRTLEIAAAALSSG